MSNSYIDSNGNTITATNHSEILLVDGISISRVDRFLEFINIINDNMLLVENITTGDKHIVNNLTAFDLFYAIKRVGQEVKISILSKEAAKVLFDK